MFLTTISIIISFIGSGGGDHCSGTSGDHADHQRGADESRSGIVRHCVPETFSRDAGSFWRPSESDGAGRNRVCDRPDHRSACKRGEEYSHLFDEQAAYCGKDHGNLSEVIQC